MRAQMMLCDHVAVAEGKLYINGGGWTVTGPMPSPSGIAIMLRVPWNDANRPVHIALELLGSDGQPVMEETPTGEATPLRVEADIEVGRPPGVREGTELPVMIPINIGPLPLPPGQRFVWQLSINGQTHEDWREAFDTRAALPPQATGPSAIGPLPGI